MISKPDEMEKELIFKALVKAIETHSGIGFHNGDQGHPAYVAGANGQDSKTWGDTPEQNTLFKLLASFDRRHHENGPDLSTWQRFCAFAVDAHNQAISRGRP